jgi:hypothetical protein
MAVLGGSGDAQGVTQEGEDLKNHFPREKLCRNRKCGEKICINDRVIKKNKFRYKI